MTSAVPIKQSPPACSQPLFNCPETGANEGQDYSADSGVSEQDGEPPSPYTEVFPHIAEAPSICEENDSKHTEDPPMESIQLNSNSEYEKSNEGNLQTKQNQEERISSECKDNQKEEVPSECDMKTDSDSQTHRRCSSEYSSNKSQDSGICNTNQMSISTVKDEFCKRESIMVDSSTQTSISQVTNTSELRGDVASEKSAISGNDCTCCCENQDNITCNKCKLGSSCDDAILKNNHVNHRVCDKNVVSNLRNHDVNELKVNIQNMRQKRTSDYSSLSSCDSPRVSDSSNRTSDSCNSPSSSSSSCSTTSGQSKRLKSSFTKKAMAASGGLSPIASCGGESSVGLTVDISLAPEDANRESGGRSPCTPTSGCLKGSTRSASGAHVQFETPCDQYEEDDCMLQDTLVTSDGRVSLHKPTYGSTTPTPTDHLSRFWSKLVSDSSPSEAVSSNLHRSKKYRKRHISGSSSISVGSSSSDSGESRATEFERKAPDGGWGWVIVAASFMVHCIADGVTMSFGVLFVELLNYFNEGKSLTSWVGSLFMAIPLLAGPLASLLTDRYGCRTVTICGAVIACFGFFVSAFVNTIPLLLLTVGIVTGLGLAVCYVAAIVIVAFYFEKKRSLATGIAVAGSGIGTFLFAPLIQYLVDYWGWRLCFVILAGIFLNMVVCGALMHDLEWTPKNLSNVHDHIIAASSRRSSTSQSSEAGLGKGGSVGTTLPSLDELRRLVQSGDIMISPDEAPNEKLRNSASLVLLPTFLSRSQVLPPDVIPCLSSRTNAYEVVSQMYPHLLSHSLSGHVNQATDQIQIQIDKKHQNSPNDKLSLYKDTLTNSLVSSTGMLLEDSGTSPVSPQQKSVLENYCDTDTTTPGSTGGEISILNGHHRKKVDIELGCAIDDGDDADNEEELEEARELTAMLGRSRVSRQAGQRRISSGCMGSSPPPPAAPLRNMRINKQSMMYRGAMLNIHRYRLRASSCPDIYRNSIITIAKAEDEAMWTYLDDMGEMITSCVDYTYCLDPGYVVFAISNFILYVFYDTVYMYLTDYAQGVGVSADDSANLISIIGILNCFGMVVMGYVGDQPWSSPMLIYNVSMILCGLSVIVMPLLTNYWLIAAAAAVFGLFISANYALTSVILVELITLEAFSKAYGMLLLIQGIANLIGPPLVGFIADETGDYLMPFVISGLFIILCGIILNLIPLIHRCQGKYAPSVTSTPVDTPKNGSPTSTPNHTIGKKKPTPI